MVVSFKNNQLLFFYHNFCAKLRKDFEIRRIKYQKTTPMVIISHPKTILPHYTLILYGTANKLTDKQNETNATSQKK